MEKMKSWFLRNNLLLALVFLNGAVVLAAIVFGNLGFLPVSKTADFLFFAGLFLFFAFYRPGWAFLFFIGLLVLENINLMPEKLVFNLRPYQFAGALVFLATMIKAAVGKGEFRFEKILPADWAAIIFVVAGFFSALFSQNAEGSFKLSLVSASFVMLYFLTRLFLQEKEDLGKVVPFFLSSVLVVAIYAVWQNFLFIFGERHFEVMPGRPNATFPEPDWLGMFFVFATAGIYASLYRFWEDNFFLKEEKIFSESGIFSRKGRIHFFSGLIFFHSLLFVVYLALILTVSRSAWLGAVAVFLFFQAVLFKRIFFELGGKIFYVKQFFTLSGVFLASILTAQFSGLTDFKLANRLQSTGTGFEKITVSCLTDGFLPARISSLRDLENYGCQHINLEEKDREKSSGRFVKEVERPDPNVAARSQIYRQSWQALEKNWLLGVGWGNIGEILGKDEQGNFLNSSNIFLEVWLGAGMVGFLAFIFLLFEVTKSAAVDFFCRETTARTFGIFLFLGLIAIVIPNLFNAGIFLGFVWVFLGLAFAGKQNEQSK